MDAEAPAGWQLLRLAECVERIISGATPKAGDPRYYGAGTIPFARIQDVVAAGGRPIDRTELAITENAVRETAAKVYPPGTALMTMYGTIGAVAVTARPMAANQAIAAFVGPQIDARFLLHMLRQEAPRLARLAGQTTQANISGQILKRHVVSVPKERGEQQRIGNILDAIDEAIEKTEAVIAATEDLRKALLQELLTRGLPGWHTEWKTVLGIGTIPACWEVVRLGEVADPNLPGATQSGPFGSDLLHSEFTDSGKLVIGIDNVLNGEFSLGSQHRISEPKFEKLRKYQARPGDVLITIMATVGRCCVVPEDVEDAVITKHVFRISADSSRANPRFVMTSLLLAPSVLSELFASAQGLTRLGLNGTLLRQIRLPLPALREQGVVADTQRILGKRLEGERQLATHLRAIKRETASALLSGRVRVPMKSEIKEQVNV